MIIHCSQQLAAKLPAISSTPLEETSPLGSWHAHQVQSSLRVAKLDLEAWLYDVPNVMDPLAMSCRLNERPVTIYRKWVRPEKTMLEAVARL